MTVPPTALYDLVLVIVDEWYGLLAPVILTPYTPDEVRQQIRELVERFIELLLGPNSSTDEGEGLGSALADYQFVQPGVFGKTQELLTKRLLPYVSNEQAARLAAIQGGMATGYFKRSRDIILAAQEAIHDAQITAYKALQQTVARSEERYRTLVESASQAIFILDRKGMLRFLNGPGAVQMGGHPRGFTGKSISDLFPASHAESFLNGVCSLIETGVPSRVEAEIPMRGHFEWFDASLTPLKNRAGEYETLLGIATNITERKLTAAALRRSTERLTILHKLDIGILEARSVEEIAGSALKYVKDLIPYWGAYVMLLDNKGSESFLFAGELDLHIVGKPKPLEHWDMATELRAGSVVFLDNIWEHPDPMLSWQDAEQPEARHSLVAPLVVGDQLIGVLALISDPSEVYGADEIQVAQEIAAPLAISIQNARLLEAHRIAQEENAQLAHQIQDYANGLEQRVDERTRELSALYDVTAVASEFLDRQTILEKTLARSLSALARKAGTIQLLEEDSQELELVAYAGVSRETAIKLNSVVAAAGLVDGIVESHKPLVMVKAENDLALEIEGYPEAYGAIVCAPLRSQGQMVGILSVFDELNKQFSVEEVALLASIADHMGVAVENARLLKQAAMIAVGEEQRRLARELHDSVTQALYSLTLFAEAAQENERAGKRDLVRDQLDDIGKTSHQALKEMRLLLYELRASKPEREGLLGALRYRLDAVELQSGMSTRLRADTIENVSRSIERGLFHIAVGALNNTIRHAEATVVDISIERNGDTLIMEISDNGKGFDLAGANRRGGMGLNIMRERAERINGQIEIRSSAGAGTRIRVSVDGGFTE